MFGIVNLYNHWGFINVNHELGKYYRSLFYLEYCLKLQRPSNGEHISIIFPEDGILLSDFHYLNGSRLEFELENILYWNGNALWVNVLSDDINKFRSYFNLKEPTIPLHFCIGYLEQNED